MGNCLSRRNSNIRQDLDSDSNKQNQRYVNGHRSCSISSCDRPDSLELKAYRKYWVYTPMADNTDHTVKHAKQ